MNEFTLNNIYLKCRNISHDVRFLIHNNDKEEFYSHMEEIPSNYWFDVIVDYFNVIGDIVEV